MENLLSLEYFSILKIQNFVWHFDETEIKINLNKLQKEKGKAVKENTSFKLLSP